MTAAINDWMVEKYPQFDSRLATKIDILEKETHLVVGRIKNIAQENQEKFIKSCREEINAFLDEKFPGMAKRFSEATLDAEHLFKRLDKKDQVLQKVLSKLSKADSLYEDVYKLRDEMKELNKVFGEFKRKMQVLFK
jgi:acyl carrier protein phosphodiesterase